MFYTIEGKQINAGKLLREIIESVDITNEKAIDAVDTYEPSKYRCIPTDNEDIKRIKLLSDKTYDMSNSL